jgi:tyrosyl-tRNA synthetase
LITGGGAYVNQRRIEAIEEKVDLNDAPNGFLMLRAGKKRYQKIVLEGE